MPRIIPFIGGSYDLDSVNIDAQRCLNWYPESVESGTGKNIASLKPTEGLNLFTTLTGNGACRGFWVATGPRFFAVCGNTLNEVATNGNVTNRGTINTTSGIVRMRNNNTQLIIVDGTDGWIFTFATNVLTEITDADYPNGGFVEYIDGYFIVNKPQSGQYQWSSLNDGTAWDALDISSAEAKPDDINAMIERGRELCIFGKDSHEWFFDSGDADAPFTRVAGSVSDIGCIAPDSLARMDNSIFWVGSNDAGYGKIFMSMGYDETAISTHTIEQAIQDYSTITDATAFCYQKNGHNFYMVSFPSAGVTWCYDVKTGLWHERSYTDQDNNSFEHRAIVQDLFNGKIYVGDRVNGKVYELDSDTYTDNGEAIHRIRSSPHIWNNLDRVYYSSFQLDMEVGTGLSTGQGVDPQMMLQWSNDGGHTWSNENWADVGKIGEYLTRVKWNRLGASRDRIFRVKITDPVKAVLIGAAIEVE